jgi:alpha-mannosidase
MSRYAPPVPLRVRRVAVALALEALPPLGYAVVDLHVSEQSPAAGPPVSSVWLDDTALENELVRIEVRADGAVDLLDKRSMARYVGVFTLEDGGDVGDEYNHSAPSSDRFVATGDATAVSVRPLLAGPLIAALSIELTLPVPAGASDDRTARQPDITDIPVSLEIRLRAASPVVECVARVDNRARDHRLRILCPTGGRKVVDHRADTAFAAIRRSGTRILPTGPLREKPVATSPLQSFVDAGDDSIGAVVIADGVTEYEVVSGEACSAIALTLIRAVGDLSRDDLDTREGHAGPGLPTPGAQCLGTHEFRFAFVPRAAPPPPGELFRTARALLAPPRLFSPCGGDGTWPLAQSWFQLGSDPDASVILSACKVADERNTVVLRVFNAMDESASLTLRPPVDVTAAYLTDLAEHRESECSAAQRGVRVDLAPHRIQTMEFVPRSG